MGQMMNKANNITADNLMKQINLLNKLSNQIQETLRSSKDTLDGEFNQKGVSSQMSSQNDTNNLISAIVFGKNLKPNQSMNTSSVNQQQMSDQRSSLPPVISGMAPTKAPSSIKTNIKAAANLHPYNR
jgi:mediator of RNA polymerase II transcription subunit 8